MSANEIFENLESMFQNNQSERVAPYLLSCINEAEEKDDFATILVACNELGGFYRAIGKYEEATEIYNKALSAISSLNIENTENHATVLINFATNYVFKGESKEAIKLFNLAIGILMALGLDSDYRMATVHNNMSMMFQDLNQPDEALKHLNVSIYILENLDDTQIEIATTYINIAQIHLQLRDLPEAYENINKSIDIFEGCHAENDEHYSIALATLGEILFSDNRFEEALKYLEKAQKLMESSYGKDTPNYETLCELIEICKTNIKLEEK
jgi:tetratricopeptide (TPR) repeat protein